MVLVGMPVALHGCPLSLSRTRQSKVKTDVDLDFPVPQSQDMVTNPAEPDASPGSLQSEPRPARARQRPAYLKAFLTDF